MKITILTYGSRGDVQPFLPLSLGLMARGHSVKLAAPVRFKSLIEQHGIDFVPLAGDPEELSRRLNDAGYNLLKTLRELMEHAVEIGADVVRQVDEACKGADLIIHTFSHAVGAHTLAREMGIPDVHIQTFPMFSPTGDYPNIGFPDFGSPKVNRFTHLVSQRISWWTAKAGYERVRKRAGLPYRRLYFPFDKDPLRPPTPILCAWSPKIIPPSTDWPSNIHVTGYFFFDAQTSYEPPRELRDFLDAGTPPVCVSFGSMVNRDAQRIDQVVCDTLRKLDQRGIILSGWGKVNRPSTKDIMYLESASHDWLLPRCKMIVHHGGAGTTSAGLRAGIPQVIIPFMADQPFWGRRIHHIGVGSRPVPVKKLSIAALGAAIVQADTKLVHDRADAIGKVVRNENGVEQAVKCLESLRL